MCRKINKKVFLLIFVLLMNVIFVGCKKSNSNSDNINQHINDTKYDNDKQDTVITDVPKFEFEDLHIDIKENYIYFTGYIKNVDNIAHKYIKIKAVYKDSFDKVLDTDSTYAVGSQEIEPEERKSFEIITKYTKSMEKGEVKILDYQ